MAINSYFNNFPSEQRSWNEFSLMEDVIVESIKIMGHNVYYIPRESFDDGDMIFGEYSKSAFKKAYLIEAYLANVDTHGGQQDFFSKFGLEIKDDDNFIISRRSFKQMVPGSIRQRPQEGDLVYIPVLHKMYEIKFVEHELMFHSIGKKLPFVYDMKCEAYRAAQDSIQTGVEEVDQVGIDNLYSIDINVVQAFPYIVDNFILGETVFQSTNNHISTAYASGTVKQWFAANGSLQLTNIVGEFTSNTLTIGQVSNAYFTTASVDTLTDYNYYDLYDNKQLNTDAGEILDFSEHNPFGTP